MVALLRFTYGGVLSVVCLGCQYSGEDAEVLARTGTVVVE